MTKEHKAIIFDMDGVIIDSEKIWRQAENEIFSSLGVIISDENSEITKSMTTNEVTKFWYNKFPWHTYNLETVEKMVISRVIQLIETENCEIKGVKEFIEKLKFMDFKIGLATNSPFVIIPTVLHKLDIFHLFDVVSSAEFETNGKPDPSIYLTTIAKLKVKPNLCIAIEDSYSGMLAAKRAGINVIAFTNENKKLNFEIASSHFHNFEEFDINSLKIIFNSD